MLDAESRFRLRQMIEQHDYVQPSPMPREQLGSHEPPKDMICVYYMSNTAPIESILVETWDILMPVIADYSGAVRVMPIRGSATQVRVLLFLEDDRFRKSRWEFK